MSVDSLLNINGILIDSNFSKLVKSQLLNELFIMLVMISILDDFLLFD